MHVIVRLYILEIGLNSLQFSAEVDHGIAVLSLGKLVHLCTCTHNDGASLVGCLTTDLEGSSYELRSKY